MGPNGSDGSLMALIGQMDPYWSDGSQWVQVGPYCSWGVLWVIFGQKGHDGSIWVLIGQMDPDVYRWVLNGPNWPYGSNNTAETIHNIIIHVYSLYFSWFSTLAENI